MTELWTEFVGWLQALWWLTEPLWGWAGWPMAGALASALLVGALLGRRWGRPPGSLGAVALLTALERAARYDHQGAFSLLREATEDPQAPPELYLALAALLRAMGHSERAAQIHRAVLERHDVDAALRTRASLSLASDLLMLGRAAEAEVILKSLPRRARRQEELSDIYSHMAQGALARQDLGEAASSFRRALSRGADNVYACEGLARLYLGQGKRVRARRLLLKALKAAPDAAPRVLPLLRASVGTPQRFDRELEKLHRAGLASPWVELEMAESAYSREELEQARQLLDALVRRHPRSLHVREAHLNLLIATADERTIFAEVDRFTALALESAPGFVCGACGHRQASSFTACPRCQETGSVRYEAAASRVVAR